MVVSAITPTPLGEGKTTTTVGLGQAFQHIGRSATIAIRQPSMGPTFGIKGGAAGGGYSQVVPMELFNLHLTGDMHAVTAAHNLCSAMVDAHLYHGNELGLDLYNITWRRVLDVNDRALRNITLGLGGRLDGVPRESGFDITAASEVMAALALCTGLHDLRERLGRIVVGYTKAGTPVTAEEIGVAGSMAVILREAIKPNLMQTLENTPALVHTGPFGNIATGNSSIVADQIGIRTSDFLLTEAGFGADMGAERFFNIKCRYSGIAPDAAVLVATVRGLKAHSGNHRIVAGRPLPEALLAENPDEVHAGGDNLRKQLENMRIHGCTPVVAINVFPGDHAADIAAIGKIAAEYGARSAETTHFADGGRGATELAEAVAEAADEPSEFSVLYPDEASLKSKIETVATRVYGADAVEYSSTADKQLATYTEAGFGNLPVCIAKTHLSISSGPVVEGRADRMDLAGARGAGFCGGRIRVSHLRRHAHHAWPGPGAGCHEDRHRRRRQHRRPELSCHEDAVRAGARPGGRGTTPTTTHRRSPVDRAVEGCDDTATSATRPGGRHGREQRGAGLPAGAGRRFDLRGHTAQEPRRCA